MFQWENMNWHIYYYIFMLINKNFGNVIYIFGNKRYYILSFWSSIVSEFKVNKIKL